MCSISPNQPVSIAALFAPQMSVFKYFMGSFGLKYYFKHFKTYFQLFLYLFNPKTNKQAIKTKHFGFQLILSCNYHALTVALRCEKSHLRGWFRTFMTTRGACWLQVAVVWSFDRTQLIRGILFTIYYFRMLCTFQCVIWSKNGLDFYFFYCSYSWSSICRRWVNEGIHTFR